MEKTLPMKYNRDFKFLYRKGNSLAGGYLVVYYKKCIAKENLLGITVTKKFGCAVMRNRVRRQIRECYRLMENSMQEGYKIVIVARNKAAGADFGAIRSDMSYLFKKSGIIKSGCEA